MIAIVAGIIFVLPGLLVLIFALLRRLKSPEKSLLNCAVNVALNPVRALRQGPFKQGSITMEKACKYAIKKTKLTDFGDTTFVSLYNIILNGKSHQLQKYSNLGYIGARIEMNMSMVRRLKFVQYLKDQPQVLNVPCRSPVFVMGLPRTGTTFLHRLLSLDPQVRAPLLWELLAPVPGVMGDATVEAKTADTNKRANFIRKLIETRRSMGDKALEHIHEVGADLPEECLMALSDELPIQIQFLYSIYTDSKPFLALATSDKITNAYVYYKKVLQLLTFHGGAGASESRRWMLKCPMHLFFTKEIAKVFPDAKLIWTHRHPISAVPSMCSLLKSIHKVYYEEDCRDDLLLGQELVTVSENLLRQAPKDIAESQLPCSHIIYNDLVKDPVSVIKGIYAQNQWVFSPEYETILQDYLEQNRQEREQLKHKKSSGASLHSYSPKEFGLTENQLCSGGYADYISQFNVPMSKN